MPHKDPAASGQRHEQRAPQNRRAFHKGWRKSIPTLLAYLFNIFLLVLVSHAEHASNPENSPKEGFLSILSPDFLYRTMLGSPEPPAQDVAVIAIGSEMPGPAKESEPSTACMRRIYIAELLKSIRETGPRTVVLDVWFDPGSCSNSDSQPLWQELCSFSADVPVVTGLASYTRYEIISDWPAEFADIKRRGAALKPSELVSQPAVPLNFCSTKRLTVGTIELDEDHRKIPLSWPVYDTFDAVGDPARFHRIDSLSVAAIRARDPKSPVLARVGAIDEYGAAKPSTNSFPYTTFLGEDDLPIVRAVDVICSNPKDYEWGQFCQSSGAKRLALNTLFAGKVVLIGGSGSGADIHDSVIGRVPGVVLQAEYVESMLKNRVYRAIPISCQIVMWILWLFLLFGISFLTSSGAKAALYLFLAVSIPAVLLHQFFVHCKFYTPLLLPLTVSGVFLLISRRLELFLSKHEEER
jgi:hypothetical protein